MAGMSLEAAGEPRASYFDADAGVVDLYRSHYQSIVRMVAVLIDDRGSAEEVAQEALVRVHGAWHRLRNPGDALAYLRSTAMNLARSQLRRRQVGLRRRPLSPVRDATPEEVVVLSEEHARALAALRALPNRQRECLTLRYYLDLTDAEVAGTLGISLGSVKTHIRRGLATVTRRLEDVHEG